MAEAIISPIAELILGKLSSFLGEEISLIWNLDGELQKFEKTVKRIRAVLLDAEEKRSLSNQEEDLVQELKEALYDADDLLDKVSAAARRGNEMEGTKKAKAVCLSFPAELSRGYKLAGEIRKNRKRMDSIAKDRRNFKIDHTPRERENFIERDQTCSFVHEKDVIGREGDKDSIMELIRGADDTKDNVSIISVVGIGGLGKTTLAQIVFNDLTIQNEFDQKIWVCVSNEATVKTIVKKIIESATRRRPEENEMQPLQDHLLQLIRGKKYMLVLDDVWMTDYEKWDRLNTLLKSGAKGSTILITTRSLQVANVSGTTHNFVLKGLSPDDSLKLFEQITFSQRKVLKNSSMHEIGKEIVMKCRGVPLAVKTMSALLSTKRTETEWLQFKGQELSSINQEESGILPILKLSYDNLPPYLKRCFAYCSLFPKGNEIDRKRLINLWISEGFIQPSSTNQCLEDVGNEYFMHLLWMSFFQDTHEDGYGNILWCKMHDLMHDLATSVAKPEFKLVNSRAESKIGKARYVSFQFDGFGSLREFSPCVCKPRKLRTLLLDGTGWGQEAVRIECDLLVSKFRYLRVLDMHDNEIRAVPKSIEELIHLRYLDFSQTKVENLPNSITNLHNLHTLSLRFCRNLRELPADLKKMMNLRHLEIDGCYSLTHMPAGLGRMTCLQTLPCFVVNEKFKHAAEVRELKDLNNLRGMLNILNLSKGGPVFESGILKNKKFLEQLILAWGEESEVQNTEIMKNETLLGEVLQLSNLKLLEVENYGGRGPTTENPHDFCLPNLVNLNIYQGAWENLPPFSWLPSLRSIKLSKLPALRNLSFSGHLPCLEFVYISSLTALTNLFLSHLPLGNLPCVLPLHELPSLSSLFLEDLTKLEYIQEYPCSSEVAKFFPSLRSLTLHFMPNLKGWWKRETEERSTEGLGFHLHFPLLSILRIDGCARLETMPFYPHIERLTLCDFNKKVLQEQQKIAMVSNAAPTTLTCSPFSKLNYLNTDNVDDIPEKLLQEHFTSLTQLDLSSCPAMTSLPGKLRHVISLQSLLIGTVKILPHWVAQFHFLQNLYIISSDEMSLPKEMSRITTLKQLLIFCCNKLKALPESISSLTSLEHIEIQCCNYLEMLPEGMAKLSSLQSLRIVDCPILKERCKSNEGNDWHKIAHVPEINIF